MAGLSKKFIAGKVPQRKTFAVINFTYLICKSKAQARFSLTRNKVRAPFIFGCAHLQNLNFKK